MNSGGGVLAGAATVPVMAHLERTGRTEHEIAVRFDVHQCGGCGASFRRLGTYRPSHRNCGTHPDGHWELECRTCRHVTPDSVCEDTTAGQIPLEGHRRITWDDVQHGPSADYGDG